MSHLYSYMVGMLDYMIWPWFERFAANSLLFPELALPAHLTCLTDWEKAMWTTGQSSGPKNCLFYTLYCIQFILLANILLLGPVI
jgi:hypothetical protein